MEDCIFCKIVKKEIPTEFIQETENFVVFKDIHPSAPIHLLIVPKNHIKDLSESPDELWIEAKNIGFELQKQQNLDGFRLAVNIGDKADVKHLHIHFAAGFSKEKQI